MTLAVTAKQAHPNPRSLPSEARRVTDPEDFGHRHIEVTAESAEVVAPYPDTDERRRLAERIPG
jgi:hypothetical protein